jgi:hypothetical protein
MVRLLEVCYNWQIDPTLIFDKVTFKMDLFNKAIKTSYLAQCNSTFWHHLYSTRSIDKYQVQKGRSELLHWKFIFLFFRITLLTRKIQSATNQKLDWVKANWTFWNMIHPTKIQITLREAWTIRTFSELPIEYVGPHLQLN